MQEKSNRSLFEFEKEELFVKIKMEQRSRTWPGKYVSSRKNLSGGNWF